MYSIVRKLLRAAVAVFAVLIIVILAFSIFYRLFPAKYINPIEKYCSEYNVDTYLVLALIKAESNFNEASVSRAEAKGLMQLTEQTFLYGAQKLNISVEKEDIFNPEKNIRIGVWYLSYLLDKYDSNTKNAIAAYNAGLANVDKWLLDPSISPDGRTLDNIPFGETQRYTDRIERYRNIYRFLYPPNGN